MEASTEAVREFYELYPYPSGAPAVRIGFDLRYLMSLVRMERRPQGRPLRVLDAGCSRGVGALACAALQPDVQVLGVDINRIALEEAEREASRRGLDNVEFAEVDLSTLAGLEIPEGGFDVIMSSGVLHHLVDPSEGLRKLKGALAPHGVLALMVYSKSGRRETLAISHAIDALVNKNQALPAQLVEARQMVQDVSSKTGASAAWKEAALVGDVEFVDRYLHIQECVYDVPGLFKLIAQGGLSFLRWMDPSAWVPKEGDMGAELAGKARALSPMEAARLVDDLGDAPGAMEVYLCQPENSQRAMPGSHDLASAVFAVHPEIRFHTMQRNIWCATRIEGIAIERRASEPQVVAPGLLTAVALILRDQNEPFQGQSLIDALVEEGHGLEAITKAILFAIDQEWVYCPHAVDLAV